MVNKYIRDDLFYLRLEVNNDGNKELYLSKIIGGDCLDKLAIFVGKDELIIKEKLRAYCNINLHYSRIIALFDVLNAMKWYTEIF